MRINAIIAARMYSQRMYGKPMKKLEGKPIIEHVIDRLNKCQMIDDIILAISENEENGIFVEFADRKGLKYIIGDENDVLERIFKAALENKTDLIVRVTSENPLIYVEEVDKLIKFHIDNKCDFTYLDNLPIGCIIEVISFEALKKSYELGSNKHHSELVTLYINEHPESFNIMPLDVPKQLQRPDYRLTVDTHSDLELMKIIYKNFYRKDSIIKLKEVIEFLDAKPDLLEINKDVPKGDSRIWD
jgi:spore coat polysaccharide biosynthesis protein SpsF